MHAHAKAFFAPIALALACLFPAPAHAEGGVTVAVEAAADVVVTETPSSTSVQTAGWGFAARGGYTFGGSLARLTPEVKIGFESPGTPNAGSLMAGARLNLFEGLSPAAFAHAGGFVGDIDGFVWEVGLGLDWMILPLLDIGVFAAFNQANGANITIGNSTAPGNWEWMKFGAQAALHF